MKHQSLVCPNCGATTTKKDYCEFCGSFLVGKLVKGIDVSRYADVVRDIPIDNGIKRMLKTFTNISDNISEKQCKLFSLNIVDVRNKNKIILVVQCSKKNIQLTYPHERFGAFANCSMYPLFEKNKVSFGMDIDGTVKFITQFINELYPNADTSFIIYVSNPYLLTSNNDEDDTSFVEEEDDREYLIEGKYNRNGDFVKGVFYEKWDEDKWDEDDEYTNEIEISSADFNLQTIEAFVNKEIKELDRIVKDKQKKSNSRNELKKKLELQLCDDKFINCVLKLGNFYIEDSVFVTFACSKNSIHLKFSYHGDQIEFGRLGEISPYKWLLDSDKKPYLKYGDWYIEKRYILEASDIKRISESQDKNECTLHLYDRWGNTKNIYSERLRMIISVIWQAVEDPVEGMSKLETLCSKKDEYQRNRLKRESWETWAKICWGIGSCLTLFVGGIWSLIVGNCNPLIWFAVVTISLGTLCLVKFIGLQSDIKAYESKYGKSY